MIIIALRYWVNNGGDWGDTAHWSLTSGGSGGASSPGINDDAIFNANSFTLSSQTVTLGAERWCINLNWTGVTNTPTFDLGSYTLNCYGTATFVVGMNISAGTSLIKMAGASKTFAGANKTYNNLEITGSLITISLSNTFNDLKINPGCTLRVTSGTIQTITSLSGDGTNGTTGLCTLASVSAGSPFHFTCTSGTFDRIYYSLKDCHITPGGATFNATHSFDLGNNDGWNITPITSDRFWIGNSGNWSDGSHWAETSGGSITMPAPTASDNAIFDINSFSIDSQTITVNVNPNCLNMDWTGVTNTPTFDLSTSTTRTLGIAGDCTFVSGMAITKGTSTITLSGNNKIFNGANKSFWKINITGSSMTIVGDNTIAQLRCGNVVGARTIKFTAGSVQNITRFGVLGTVGNVITFESTSDGVPYHIELPFGKVTFNYCSIKDMHGVGGTWVAYNSTDVSGNDNISFLAGNPEMDGRYFVPVDNNVLWSNTDSWSTVSGGVSGASIPTSSNNVYMDENSWSSEVTVMTNGTDKNVLDFDTTGSHIHLSSTSTGDYIFIYGNAVFNSDLNTSSSNSPSFRFKATTSGKTVTMNSVEFDNAYVWFDGVNGEWTLQDEIFATDTSQIVLANGTFISNGNSINMSIATSGIGTKVIDLTDSIVTCRNINFAATTGLTFIAPDKVILQGTGSIFYGGSLEWNDLECQATNTTMAGNNTFNDLKLNADKTLKITAASLQIVSSLSGDGTSGHLAILQSTINGSSFMISSPNEIMVDYWSIKDCEALNHTPFLAAHSTDVSNNTNWSFGEPRYWVGNSGNWTDDLWSTSSGGASGAALPTKIDDVYFDVNSFDGTGQTMALVGDINCANMNWSGVINTPTLSLFGATSFNIYGNLTLVSGMTVDDSGYTGFLEFKGKTLNKTITCSGKTLPDITFTDVNGGWVLQDNLTVTKDITLTAGILNINGKTINIRNFVSSGTINREIIMGAGTLNISGNWTASTDTSLTVTPNTSTINMTGNTKNFTGGNKTYNILDFVGTPITVINNNIFNELKFHGDKTVNFTAGSTQTITTLSGNGTSGHLVTIQSTSSGNYFTFLKTSGSVDVTYWSIKDSHVGSVVFNAGTGCVDVSGNVGWTFSSLPAEVTIPLTTISINAIVPIIQHATEVTIPLTTIDIVPSVPTFGTHAPTKFILNNVDIVINNKYIHLNPASTLTYSDNIQVPEDFTLIFYIMLPGAFTGEFLDFNDDLKFGYDGDKFYYEKSSTPTYGVSQVLPDGMFKVGITNEMVKVYGGSYDEIIYISEIPEAYSSVRFSGESWLDNIHLQDGTLTETEIDATVAEQIRNLNSQFLANFNDTLQAGNLTAGGLGVDQWRIKRKRATDALYTNIGLIDYASTPTSMSFTDFSPRLNVNYEYAIYSVLEGVEGEGFNGYMSVDTWSWVLEEDYVIGGASTPTWQYVFSVQNQTDSIITNRDIKKIENYTVYPSFRTGNRLYDSSGMSTLPYTYGTSDSQIQVTLEILEDLKEKINDGLPKILRNYKGQIWRIITHDFSVQYMDEILSQPFSLKFQWDEIGFT